jgi:ketosteroid isomerase-like protein
VPTDKEDLLRQSYAAFNARDVGAALATMHPDVDWPDMIEGRRIIGLDAVRRYWLAQFEAIDPHVEPTAFATRDDDAVAADVHQVVRTKHGDPVSDQMVEHVYTFREGLVAAMDVYVDGVLASAARAPAP